MKIESDTMYIVNLADGSERYVFTEKEELADFLEEQIENPEEKVKEAIMGEVIVAPEVFGLEVPDDLIEGEWSFIRQKIQKILVPRYL